MSYKTYINLPVDNLDATKTFFTQLGFKFDPNFTDTQAAGMIINEGHSYAMLLSRPFFHSFFPHKAISDAKAQVEVSIALQCDSKEAVDALIAKAISAGGKTYNQAQDHGFMYGHGFEDLDGHIWEVFTMTPPANQQE
ncbi:MAG: glyoxalase/bleomycin resistance/extradiol dioxygenase family protein [Thiothrix sp.]|nr:MAG: glyoxalase/bleomycin resistance/extradiol dioxygenase family protein [Thiothrix sp.]